MGRDKRTRGHDPNRVNGRFVAIPVSVLDCQAYLALSHPAKSLLIEIARQYVRDNNGRLLASRAYLAKRGWNSADTITRALRELIDARLIHQTVKGHRPNKASWFAITWMTLDRLPGYDPGAVESFERGSYEKVTPKNARLKPSNGPKALRIGPQAGQLKAATRPSDGTIETTLDSLPDPPDGHLLDKPSPVSETTMESNNEKPVTSAPRFSPKPSGLKNTDDLSSCSPLLSTNAPLERACELAQRQATGYNSDEFYRKVEEAKT